MLYIFFIVVIIIYLLNLESLLSQQWFSFSIWLTDWQWMSDGCGCDGNVPHEKFFAVFFLSWRTYQNRFALIVFVCRLLHSTKFRIKTVLKFLILIKNINYLLIFYTIKRIRWSGQLEKPFFCLFPFDIVFVVVVECIRVRTNLIFSFSERFYIHHSWSIYIWYKERKDQLNRLFEFKILILPTECK